MTATSPRPGAPTLVGPVDGAIQIAEALRAAGFDAPQIATAIVSPDVYPALSALQLGMVLLDPSVFPSLSRADMAAALTAPGHYPAEEILAAIAILYAKPRPLGPIGGGSSYYGPPIDFDDLAYATQLQQPITGINGRAGAIVDSLQAVYGQGLLGPQHGGDGGAPFQVRFEPGDLLVGISGYFGAWFESVYVLQLVFETRRGRRFGPYGSMQGAIPDPFRFAAADGEQIVALFGQIAPGLRAFEPPTLFVDQLGCYARPF